MLQVKRVGHATLTTPDIGRQVAYYTEVVGLTVVAREASRAAQAEVSRKSATSSGSFCRRIPVRV